MITHHDRYAFALTTVKLAQRRHDTAAAKYRIGKITEAEYLAARKALADADTEFNAAAVAYADSLTLVRTLAVV